MTDWVQCTIEPVSNKHDAIIQTLDRFLGYDENFYPILFPTDVYRAALGTVNNAKIIFSGGVHPDYDLYEMNPDQAVRDVGGRYAGVLTDANIDMIGHPTTKATLVLDPPDPDIEQLISEGKLSLSPSLGLTRDEAGNIISVKFQNLLIFPETPNGMAVPGDPGTKILNSKTNQNPKTTGTTMSETIVEKPVIDPALVAQLTELSKQFSVFKQDTEVMKKENEEARKETEALKLQLSKKNEEIAAKEEALKTEKEAMIQLTKTIEEEKKAAKEREFQGLIHDPLFPPGLLKEENSEELLRAEFTESPAQFTRKVLSVYVTQNNFLETKGQEQGQQFSKPKGDSKWDTNEGRMILGKLGLKREQMGA